MGLIVLASGSSQAAAYIYSQSRQEIRACILLLPGVDSANTGYKAEDYNAGLFSVLQSRIDLKPAGWDLVNPLAPPLMNDTIRNRYSNLIAQNPNLNIANGQLITKQMPFYWDVRLSDVTLSRLLQFDLVYLPVPVNRQVTLNANQREMLRKLVDSGATLWIDWGGGANNPISSACSIGFLVDDVNFRGQARQGAFISQRHHPTLSYPFWLNEQEINALGFSQAAGVVANNAGGSPAEGLFTAVVRNGGPGALPQIASARYGSGHILMTANNIGLDITRRSGGQQPMFASVEDLKFAYNVIGWGSNYLTTFKDAAHSSSSSEGPGAPLVQRWAFPGSPPATGSAPVIYKGVVFYSDAGGNVHAFDGVPQQDLDGDGNPDDGVPDLAAGAPFDRIWTISPGGSLSGPTVATWPGGNGIPPGTDVLLVNANGTVLAISAFPTPLANPASTSLFSIPGGYTGGQGVPAPTFHNGIIYAVGADGRLYCYDPASGDQWTMPHPTIDYAISPPRPYPATVGWKQDAGTQALDLMAYWVNGTQPAGSDASEDRVFASILSVRNEPLARLAGNLVANRFRNARDVLPGSWTMWAMTGPEFCDAITGANITNAGEWTLGTVPVGFTAATPVYVDYMLERAQDSGLTRQNLRPRTLYQPIPRASIQVGAIVDPWNANGPPAMGPDGTIYLSGSRGSISQLYAIRENGPRFNVQGDQGRVPNQTMPWHFWFGSITSTFGDSDPLVGAVTLYPAIDFTLDSSSSGQGIGLHNFEISGPPAVTTDAVYVTAVGETETGQPVVGLFAFATEWQFRIVLAPGTQFTDALGNRLPVRIWQPDPYSSGPSIIPPLQEAARVPDSMIDYGRRTITIENFEDIKIAQNTIQRPLTPGIPVVVFVGDVQVAADSSNFSNLKWYYIPYRPDVIRTRPDPEAPGSQVAADRDTSSQVSPPSVLGEHVYFGTGGGYIYAVRTDATPNRGKQVFSIAPNYMPLSDWDASPQYAVWQEKIATGGITNPIAGAGGLLAVGSSLGLAVYDSPGTLIADSNRIIEVDGGARITWALDATIEQSFRGDSPVGPPTAYSQRTRPFSKPSVVRHVDGANMVVADTGNNRIVRIDRAGNIIHRIESFQDPMGVLSSGEPLNLAGPTDVRAWTSYEIDPVLNIPAVVYHYLIADRDNFRILDIIIRFDLQTGAPLGTSGPLGREDRATPVVNWTTSSRAEGRLLRYETAQMVQGPGANEFSVMAAVSNYAVASAAGGGPELKLDPHSGGLVQIGYAVRSIQGGQATYTYTRPGAITGATSFIGGNRQLANPRFFERIFVGTGQFRDIVCDNAGVFELDQNANIVWALTSDTYRDSLPQSTSAGIIPQRGVPLQAARAKVLPNGRMLIANRYSGIGASGNEFRGEVFEVNRTNLAGNPISAPTEILWSAPAITLGTDGNPRQEIRGSYILEQPTYVDRR